MVLRADQDRNGWLRRIVSKITVFTGGYTRTTFSDLPCLTPVRFKERSCKLL